MKIVRIIARLNVGGPARHVTWLTDELNDAEFQSILVAGTVPGGEEDMSYLATERGIKPFYIPEMSRELSLKDTIAAWKLFRLFRRERPDIVHTHTAKAGTVGRIAALLYRFSRPLGAARLKVVHTFHGHVFHSYYSPAKTRIFLLIERVLARFATDRIITISEQQRSEILEEFRIGGADQFAVIPLGIDLEALVANGASREAVRREMGAAADELVVGFVGRLTEIKNIPMLLDVARLYLSSTGPAKVKLRFVIVGDGHMRPQLETQANTAGLAETVVFLGNRTDVAEVYAGFDIVVLTSMNEGTPLSLIEAMAASRPFVTTVVGGVVDLLGEKQEDRDGFSVRGHGIAVSSGDRAGFLRGLLYLAENERLRARMAADGRSFVERHYSKSRLINDIKELYRGRVKGK